MMGNGTVSVRTVGHLPTGEAISAVELSNEYMQVTLLDLGATLWKLLPQGHASATGITLAHDDPLSYAANPPYLGCTVGPLANRVGGSAFVLDGQRFELTPNEGAHHLHGGPTGFGHRVWDTEPGDQATEVVFRLHRSDGEGGYPGNLDVAVTVWCTTTAAAGPGWRTLVGHQRPRFDHSSNRTSGAGGRPPSRVIVLFWSAVRAAALSQSLRTPSRMRLARLTSSRRTL